MFVLLMILISSRVSRIASYTVGIFSAATASSVAEISSASSQSSSVEYRRLYISSDASAEELCGRRTTTPFFSYAHHPSDDLMQALIRPFSIFFGRITGRASPVSGLARFGIKALLNTPLPKSFSFTSVSLANL